MRGSVGESERERTSERERGERVRVKMCVREGKERECVFVCVSVEEKERGSIGRSISLQCHEMFCRTMFGKEGTFFR